MAETTAPDPGGPAYALDGDGERWDWDGRGWAWSLSPDGLPPLVESTEGLVGLHGRIRWFTADGVELVTPPLPVPRNLAAELVDRGDGWHVSPELLGTSGGVPLTDETIARLSAEAEAGYPRDRLVERFVAEPGPPPWVPGQGPPSVEQMKDWLALILGPPTQLSADDIGAALVETFSHPMIRAVAADAAVAFVHRELAPLWHAEGGSHAGMLRLADRSVGEGVANAVLDALVRTTRPGTEPPR